jgi:PAS domain S-box-containing protein
MERSVVMGMASSDALARPLLEPRVLAEKVRMLYARASIAQATVVVNASIVSWIFWGRVPPGLSIAWVAALCALAAARIGLVRAYRRRVVGPSDARVWAHRFAAGAALTGIAWGAAALIFYVPSSPAHQVFLAFVLGGMTAGAASSNASYAPAFVAFAAPALLPMVVRLTAEREPISAAMAFMMALFGIAVARISRTGGRDLEEAIRLRFRNEGLVEGLTAARANLESLNAGLERRVSERTSELERMLALRRASEARLAVTLRSIGDAVIATDGEGCVTVFNGVAEELTGWKAEEAIGRPLPEIFSIINEDTRRPAVNPMDRVLREGVIAGLASHTALVARDGAERPIADSCAPIRDSSGRKVGVVLVFRDQTAERRAEQALRESEARLRLALDAAKAGTWEWDLRTNKNLWSDGLWRLYGLEPYCREPSYEAWREVIHPDDREQAERIVQEAARTGSELNVQWRVRDREGATRWLMAQGQPVREGGGAVARFIGIVLDITDRKKAEEAQREAEGRYRSLFENITEEVHFWQIVRDEKGQIKTWRLVDANPPALRTWGRTLDEVKGRTADESVGPGTTEHEMSAVRKVIAEQVPYVFEDYFPNLDRYFRFTTIPLGESFITTGTDITAIRKAQNLMEQHNEELREADRRKNEFIAVLSHELRNPLAPIRNSLYLLERAPPGSERLTRAREIIQRQVGHLTRLVDDLLDVTRISRGKVELQRSRIDAREVVRRACDDHRALLHDRRLELRVATADPVWIEADETRIAQVVGNLLQNAAKFGHAGGAVTVSVGTSDGQAQIRVRDDGIGIPPDFLPRVFEPFVQADVGLARTKGGLGLGLALVKGLVELHGGSVGAYSDGAGGGAEFVVNLPLTRAPERPALGPLRSGPKRAMEILVIEDNVDAARSIAEVLETEGHRVHVATDGLSGIAMVRALKPEVVLCDIGLPDIDGYEIARAIRADDELRSTRLIALSGYARPEDRLRAMEAGFDVHLRKPPSLDALLASAAGGGER